MDHAAEIAAFRDAIERALAEHGRIRRAAKALGWSPRTLRRRMEELGIAAPPAGRPLKPPKAQGAAPPGKPEAA